MRIDSCLSGPKKDLTRDHIFKYHCAHQVDCENILSSDKVFLLGSTIRKLLQQFRASDQCQEICTVNKGRGGKIISNFSY